MLQRSPLFFAILIVVASPAKAAVKLPISGIYGGASACSLYAEGGGNAVFSAGASIRREISVDADVPDYMVVSPEEIVGFEWACEPIAVADDIVTLQCPGSQVSPDFGQPELITVEVREDLFAGILSYTDDMGTVTLPSCEW